VGLNSCGGVELGVGVDGLEVLVDVRDGRLEELGHLGLGEPDGVGVEADLDARAAVLGLVEDELLRRVVA